MNTHIYKRIVESVFEVKLDNKTRQLDHVVARSCYYYLCRNKLKLSLAAIAKTLNKNHATILYALREFDNILCSNPYYKSLFDKALGLANMKVPKSKYEWTIEELLKKYNSLLIKMGKMENKMKNLRLDNKELREDNEEMERIIVLMSDTD